MLLSLTLALLAFTTQTEPLVAETRALIEGLMAGRTAPVFAKFDAKMAAALSEAQMAQVVTTVR
jgi:hypothetical protein